MTDYILSRTFHKITGYAKLINYFFLLQSQFQISTESILHLILVTSRGKRVLTHSGHIDGKKGKVKLSKLSNKFE